MVALQASIGALNDVVDAPADADGKPGKPIPAGVVSSAIGTVVVVLGAFIGLALAAPSGLGTLAIAGLVLSIGYAYDLGAKGTAWSWLPFAVGIPVLPVFAWFSATGTLPTAFAVLLPAAVAAGAALAIANALADVERDRAAGVRSVALRLGLERGWLVQSLLLLAVIVVALASAWLGGTGPVFLALAVLAAAVIAGGLALGRGGDPSPARRERAWEMEAVGVALLAAAWLAGIASAR